MLRLCMKVLELFWLKGTISFLNRKTMQYPIKWAQLPHKMVSRRRHEEGPLPHERFQYYQGCMQVMMSC